MLGFARFLSVKYALERPLLGLFTPKGLMLTALFVTKLLTKEVAQQYMFTDMPVL